MPGRRAAKADEKTWSVGSCRTYIVSACLAGVRCRYDGSSCEDRRVVELVRSGRAIPVCPEQLGGLPTPRLPARIVRDRGAGGKSSCVTAGSLETAGRPGGEAVLDGLARVVNSEGQDVTGQFLRGAEECLRVARLVGANTAILKSGSPSCGCSEEGISGGCPAEGVAAALLRRNGVRIASERI